MKKTLLILLALIGCGFLAHAFFSLRPYNVVLVTIDTLRADYLHCYNTDSPARTPNMDRIASQSVMFTRAFTTAPITLPAHTAILTSHPPHELKVFNNGDIFDHKVPMVTDLVELKGYHTAGFISLGVLKGTFGLSSGFNTYEDNFDKYYGRYYKVASEVNDLVIPWIEKERKNRFFAWVHYSDPHEPYIPVGAPPDTEILVNGQVYGKYCLARKEKIVLNFTAKPGENQVLLRGIVGRGPKKIQEADSKRFVDKDIFTLPVSGVDLQFGDDWTDIKLSTGADARLFVGQAVMKVFNESKETKQVQLRFAGGVHQQRIEVIRQNYTDEVEYVDKYLGQLWDKLDQLGLRNNTIVIVTADHGEGLKTHGNLGHVERLYNETVHVPLMIYYPNMGYRGRVVDAIVSHLDIMPTILDLLHVKNKSPMRGFSLKRYLSWSPVDWLFSKKVERPRTFTATYAPEAKVNSYAMVNGQLKLIHTPKKEKRQWEAYDLVQDARERKNLAIFDPTRFSSPELSSLRGILEDFRREAEEAHSRRKNPELDEEQQRMLRDLGYIAGDDDEP